MKKRLLGICMSAMLLLCFSGSVFALSLQEGMAFDGRNWWYRDIGLASGLNYTEQLDFIAVLNDTAYGGAKNWRFAKDYEVSFLVNSYIGGKPKLVGTTDPFYNYISPTKIDIIPTMSGNFEANFDYYGRALSMGQGIAGMEFYQYVESGEGYYEELTNIPITESYKNDCLGAWIVSTRSVPEPSMFLLFGGGLISLTICRMKCKKR